MKQLLAIETSSEACSVALRAGGQVYQRHVHAPLRHAELLLPAVRELLAEAGQSLENMAAITFGRGPGSFTSLRIGIGVVQGLAWAAQLPVVPISSLAALAQAAMLENATIPGRFKFILAAMDARMGEVFHGAFEVSAAGGLTAVGPEAVSPPERVEWPYAAQTLGVGNAFDRYPGLIPCANALPRVMAGILPSASALLPLADRWLQDNKPLPAAAAQPVYIRDHVADKPSQP